MVRRSPHSLTKVIAIRIFIFQPICVLEVAKSSYFPTHFWIDSLDFAIMAPLVPYIGRQNREKGHFQPGEDVCATFLIPNQGAGIMG